MSASRTFALDKAVFVNPDSQYGNGQLPQVSLCLKRDKAHSYLPEAPYKKESAETIEIWNYLNLNKRQNKVSVVSIGVR